MTALQKQALDDFMYNNPEFSRIVVEENDIVLYLVGSEEPFTYTEFVRDSPTRNKIEDLLDSLEN